MSGPFLTVLAREEVITREDGVFLTHGARFPTGGCHRGRERVERVVFVLDGVTLNSRSKIDTLSFRKIELFNLVRHWASIP